MKVNVEELPERLVQLEIEVDEDRLEQSLNKAYRKIAQRTKIPGFRPGKAPRSVVEGMIGREGLINEALDDIVPAVYNEAIEQEGIRAIDQPRLQILENEPLRFTATVPVRPEVDLGDYKAVRVDWEEAEVSDEEFNEQMLRIRRSHATLVPVERGAQWEDILGADVSAAVDGEPFVNDEGAEFPLREGQQLLVEGLAEAFLEMKAGDEKTLDLDIQDDFEVEQFQGKTASFTIKVTAVKEEELPEEDDEFAQRVNSEDFETIDDLRTQLRNDMQEAATSQANSEYRNKVLDAFVEVAKLDYPQILVEREIDTIIQEQSGNDGGAFQAQLASIGKSESEFRDTFREAAEGRVRRSLVLSTFSEEEAIEVDDADIEAEGEKMMGPLGDGENAEQLRQIFLSDQGKATIGRNLLTDKTLERLAAIARGDGEETTSD